MASSTTNLGLRKPDTTDNWSVQDDFNANMGKIDEFAGNANSSAITNQYSNILDAINAFRTVKTFPFAINKSGTSAYADIPSGLSNTCEWNVICFGNATRITAVLTVYTGGSSMNGWSWTANIYNGSYILDWTSLNSDIANLNANALLINNQIGMAQVTDLNNIGVTSLNSYGGNTANAPTTNGGTVFTAASSNGSQRHQLAFPNNQNFFAYRNFHGTWSAWTKITTGAI